MRKLDWANSRKYLASGSPVLLLGSSVITLLERRHLLSYGRSLALFAAIFAIGAVQARLASKRNAII